MCFTDVVGPRENGYTPQLVIKTPRFVVVAGGLCYSQNMAVFKPPTDNFVTWNRPDEEGIFAYLMPGPRGRNVFKMLDGSFQESEPSDPETIAHTYHGGHIHELTAQEEADLRAAGYGDYIE